MSRATINRILKPELALQGSTSKSLSRGTKHRTMRLCASKGPPDLEGFGFGLRVCLSAYRLQPQMIGIQTDEGVIKFAYCSRADFQSCALHPDNETQGFKPQNLFVFSCLHNLADWQSRVVLFSLPPFRKTIQILMRPVPLLSSIRRPELESPWLLDAFPTGQNSSLNWLMSFTANPTIPKACRSNCVFIGGRRA